MSLPTKFLLITFLLTLQTSILISKTIAVSETINQICTRSHYHDFCVKILTKDPAHDSAPLVRLASDSLIITDQAVVAANTYIESELKRSPNQVLEHCKTNYQGSMAALIKAREGLKLGDYGEFDLNSDIALENFKDCERVIGGGEAMEGLDRRNTDVVMKTDISATIGDMLSHP